MAMAETVMTVLMSVAMGDENWQEEMFEVPSSFFGMEEISKDGKDIPQQEHYGHLPMKEEKECHVLIVSSTMRKRRQRTFSEKNKKETSWKTKKSNRET